MSPRQSSLARYYPVILPAALLALTFISYQLYHSRSSAASKKLKRSNAQRRIPRRNPRRNNATSTAPSQDPDPGGMLSDEQLHERLNQDGGIEIPYSLAEPLIDAAVAAQEARGAARDGAVGGGGGGVGGDGRGEDAESDFSFPPEEKENQNLLNLLYLIAEDQAKRESYVHRGVTCNSCGIIPIRGIRYRCANCVDFDLCEHCEALESHPKTHLFYKVRIPAPFLGNPRQAQPPWYPGKPNLMPMGLPQEVVGRFGGETGFEPPEIEALYEQFKCLAATEYLSDPLSLHAAISRQTFDKCFVPNTHVRPPPPNLIYDRMFAFYDTNNDGLIGFEEFVRGLSALTNKNKYSEKLKRVFNGYDLDGDGFVNRKDFLKMFRAFYALSKDLVKDIVASMEDDMLEANQAVNVLLGSQPISAAFAGSIPMGNRRPGKGGVNWDQAVDTEVEQVILDSGNDRAQRSETFWGTEEQSSTLEDGEPQDWNPSGQLEAAPEEDVQLPTEEQEQEREALGKIENSREKDKLFAEKKAKELEAARKEFYLDDEGSDKPEEEREGEDRLEKDVGGEILYQISEQGINELLDLLFAAKEQLALEARWKEKEEKEKQRKKKTETKQEPTNTTLSSSPPLPPTDSEELEPTPISTSSPNLHPTSETTTPSPEPTHHLQPPTASSTSPEPTTITTTTLQTTPPPQKSKIKPVKDKENARENELEAMRAEMKQRGGMGRLNYDEFEVIMKSDAGRKLSFVFTWIDMASF